MHKYFEKENVSFKEFKEGCFYSKDKSLSIYYIKDGLPTGVHEGSKDSELTIDMFKGSNFKQLNILTMQVIKIKFPNTLKKDIQDILDSQLKDQSDINEQNIDLLNLIEQEKY